MAYLLHQFLRQSAERWPDAIALVDRQHRVSYAELDQMADRVATSLGQLGVRPGDTVALLAPKSGNSVAAIYGIMRARAAYVPIDRLAPPARVAHILRDCGARVLVTTLDAWASFSAQADVAVPLMMLSGEGPKGSMSWAEVQQQSPALFHGGTECDLAYILYTSGSTGRPKGVMLTHRNALTFVDWCVATFQPQRDDRFASHAPFHFDLSIHDLYVPAACGGSVHLLPGEDAYFPAAVDAFIRSEQITVWYSVPSALIRLTRFLAAKDAHDPYPRLRLVHFAGEPYPIRELRSLRVLLPGAKLVNLYGPTETNVCTYYPVQGLELEQLDALPIGRACDNMEVFAVTEAGTLARPGEEGELWVRGPGVMRGYLNLPDETAARLIHNPFSSHLPELVYRTGDIVVPTAGGDYLFRGRRDHQVKLRGYRVELGEIEATLVAHPGVIEAAALVVGAGNDQRLEVFLTPRGDATVSANELAHWCRTRLPSYMAPDAIHIQEALPLTSTGKVDRQALKDWHTATRPHQVE